MKKIFRAILCAMLILSACFSLAACGSKRLDEIDKGRSALYALNKDTATAEDVASIFRKYRLYADDIWGEREFPGDSKSEEYKIQSKSYGIEEVIRRIFTTNGKFDEIAYDKFAADLVGGRYGIERYRCAALIRDGEYSSYYTFPVKESQYAETYTSAMALFIKETTTKADREAMAKEALFDYLKDPESLIVRSADITTTAFGSIESFYQTDKYSNELYAKFEVCFSAKNSYGGYDVPKTAVFTVRCKFKFENNTRKRVYTYEKISIF